MVTKSGLRPGRSVYVFNLAVNGTDVFCPVPRK